MAMAPASVLASGLRRGGSGPPGGRNWRTTARECPASARMVRGRWQLPGGKASVRAVPSADHCRAKEQRSRMTMHASGPGTAQGARP